MALVPLVLALVPMAALLLGVSGYSGDPVSGRARPLRLGLRQPCRSRPVLILWVSGTPHVLGAAGESGFRLPGGGVPARLLSAVALVLWVAAPLETARRLLARRDL